MENTLSTFRYIHKNIWVQWRAKEFAGFVIKAKVKTKKKFQLNFIIFRDAKTALIAMRNGKINLKKD